jgi:hypothetical protein
MRREADGFEGLEGIELEIGLSFGFRHRALDAGADRQVSAVAKVSRLPIGR